MRERDGDATSSDAEEAGKEAHHRADEAAAQFGDPGIFGFERGVPVSLDGRQLPLHELIIEANHLVGAYGWGRLDMVENRRVGIKSRETYEAPGALALMMAHADLESRKTTGSTVLTL